MSELRKRLSAYFLYGATRRDAVFSCVIIALCLVLWFVPTGFEDRLPVGSLKLEGRVVEVDNSLMTNHGLVRVGGQVVEVELLEGPNKGMVVTAHNTFLGKMELDKVFAPGDHALMNFSMEVC